MPEKPNAPTRAYEVIRGGIQLTKFDPVTKNKGNRLEIGDIVQLTDRKAKSLINKVKLVLDKPTMKPKAAAPPAAPKATAKG